MKTHYKISAVLALVASVYALDVVAETLYIRPSADCANSGDGSAYACAASGGAPGAWRGMAAVVFNAADTAGQVDAGDTLKTCGSFTTADRMDATNHLYISVSGAVGSRITVTGDCSADGGSSTSDWDGGTSTARGINTDVNTDITVKNLVIHDFTSRGALLYSHGTNDIVLPKRVTLEDLTIYTIRGASAICVDGRGKFITISNVIVRDCGTDAVFQKGSNFTVEDSTISEVSMDNVNGGDGIQIDGDQDGSIIRRNSIDMTSVDSKYCILTNGNTDSGSVFIEDNTCLRSLTAMVGIGIDVDTVSGSDSRIVRNTVTGGLYAIQVNEQSGGKVYIVGNVLITPSENCFRLSGAGSGNIFVQFNTCINPVSDGTQVDSDSPTITIRGNIFTGGLFCIDKRSANTEAYNILYGCGTAAVANSGVQTTTGTGTSTSDPSLVSSTDYRTRGGSIARRAALFPGFCHDVRGRPCWSPPDIGAYQATSGDPANTRTAR